MSWMGRFRTGGSGESGRGNLPFAPLQRLAGIDPSTTYGVVPTSPDCRPSLLLPKIGSYRAGAWEHCNLTVAKRSVRAHWQQVTLMKKLFIAVGDGLAISLAISFLTWTAWLWRQLPAQAHGRVAGGALLLMLIGPGLLSALVLVFRAFHLCESAILGKRYATLYSPYGFQPVMTTSVKNKIAIFAVFAMASEVSIGYVLSFVAEFFGFFTTNGPLDRLSAILIELF